MKLIAPLAFAFLAALGNALFVAGQKKAIMFDNPFAFIALAAMICVVLTLLAAPFFGQTQYQEVIKANGFWALVSGVGLFLTYLGFNLLYTHYGASHYIVYAVLSIITTAIIVGVLMFRESFNLYHFAAFLCSLATVVLFSIGNLKA